MTTLQTTKLATGETLTIGTNPDDKSWLNQRLGTRAEELSKLNWPKLVDFIKENQKRLWDTETALNIWFDDRLRLEKGWAHKSNAELGELGMRVEHLLNIRLIELAEMEATYGKADDIRKEIVANKTEYEECCKKVNVIPTFCLPLGFRSMNPYQLQSLLASSKDAVEFGRKRVLERGAQLERKQAEAEIRARHEEELKRISAERNALRDTRKAELESILTPYTETMAKLLAHPVLRSANVKLAKLTVDLRTEMTLGSLGDEGYALLLKRARDDVAHAMRKMREPLRRAHQSAHSRGATKLGFEAYLREEGFESLLA